jgi:NAD(P)-dependent dehydrogenase (short-subunit alcohol dehydrogenase family)
MHTRDMFDLTGKVALVTGGSRGLGLYMAHGLAEMGAHVAISARSEEDLASAKGELAERGLSAAAIPHDLGNLDTIGQLVDRVIDELGDIDILINNAGIAIPTPAAEHSRELQRQQGRGHQPHSRTGNGVGPIQHQHQLHRPGTFPSQMTAATMPAAHLARVMSKTPLQRVGGEDDIKAVAAFLVSEASRHLTGQYVVLDGGAITTNYPTVEAFS